MQLKIHPQCLDIEFYWLIIHFKTAESGYDSQGEKAKRESEQMETSC